MPYILDIETTYDPKLVDVYCANLKAPKNIKNPDKIEEHLEKKRANARNDMKLDHDFADIICVGVKELGKEPMVLTIEEYAKWLKEPWTAEEAPLSYGKNKVTNASKKMITFNGSEFDIPIIIKTGLKKGLDLPYRQLIEMCGKYQKTHIDLMQVMGVTWGKHKSLDKYLQIYFGISKKPIDFESATVDEIKEHCAEDIVNTERLYLLIKDKLL